MAACVTEVRDQLTDCSSYPAKLSNRPSEVDQSDTWAAGLCFAHDYIGLTARFTAVYAVTNRTPSVNSAVPLAVTQPLTLDTQTHEHVINR